MKLTYHTTAEPCDVTRLQDGGALLWLTSPALRPFPRPDMPDVFLVQLAVVLQRIPVRAYLHNRSWWVDPRSVACDYTGEDWLGTSEGQLEGIDFVLRPRPDMMGGARMISIPAHYPRTVIETNSQIYVLLGPVRLTFHYSL